MERLGPSLFRLGLPYEQRLAILCDAASMIWRQANDSGLPTGAEKAAWLIGYIAETWNELDNPCSERTIEHALACAQRRLDSHDEERAVLVHGDVQQWNALSAGDGFKLVDPDGLLAEPEYDLGVILREDPDEPLAADPEAILITGDGPLLDAPFGPDRVITPAQAVEKLEASRGGVIEGA